MQANTFGKAFSISTFGESHGPAVGVVIDGCPPLVHIDESFIQKELDRRKPGQSAITTQRSEDDQVEILSGVFEGKSTGQPICMMIKNKDARSKDYGNLQHSYRPSHADFVYQAKYGIRDYRGGGRASARETAARVAAGAVAKLILKQQSIDIIAFVKQVGTLELPPDEVDYSEIEKNIVRCPNASMATKFIEAIDNARRERDSLGGTISCHINNCPVGLGEPVFDKLDADLAKAMLSIPAVKGFEIGSGFAATKMKGSTHNDEFVAKEKGIGTRTNNSGGVQGGISNGEQIYFNVAFKPVATIAQNQQTVDDQGNSIELQVKGRHDPCVVPRAVPIVEAMAALVVCDHLLRHNVYTRLASGS
ncbi:chorismate synthase [bacterium]|nr:chorismate synthase [bacterium]